MNTLSTRPFSQSHRLLLRLSFSTAASPSSLAFPSPSPSHFQRRSNEESRAVRVSVWWDFENCSLPSGVNVFRVAQCITSALRVSGIKGPVQITAFGDIIQLARPNQEALSATGITLTHVPSGGKNSADRSLLVDLMYWVSHNPPPAHLFLISGDRDFAGILHRLRMSNYNILLACPDNNAPSVLCSAASIMWHWNALVKGESFACKHFNQPPDGPYNSWYGHYKGVLEDPYAVTGPKLPASSHTDDTSDSELVCESEVVPEHRLQPVPRDVLRKMSKIVNSHPKGMLLTLLQRQMLSGEVSMDKHFYGHKSFSQFLLSKPNLVKIKQSKGHFLVFPASREASEPVKCSADGETLDSSITTKQKVEPKSQDTEPVESISDSENLDLAASSVPKAQANSVTRTLNEKLPVSSTFNVDEMQKKSDTVSDNKEIYAQGKEGSKPSSGNQDSEDGMGYFQKMWTKWFKKNDMGSEEKTDRTSVEVQGLAPEPLILVESHVTPDSPQSSDDRVTMDAKVDTTIVHHGDKSEHSPGFFTKLLGWFKLPRKDTDADISNESIEMSKHAEESKKDELFLMDSFWSDVESFLNTYKGSKLIWNSKTREEIAQNLRKEGPLVIQPLAENDLLHLIDLLISEKKWIKELPLSPCPFRVVRVTKAESAQSNNSGRLRSMVMGSSSQPEKLPDQQDKGKLPFDTTTKPCWKTKDEVLADCKKLLDDMFRASPEAINIGLFNKKFFEKYGYVVDYRKLGYPKLISLLQTFPDLRVGLNYVYCTVPKELTPTDIEDKPANSGVGTPKDKENDSPWEELGPVDGRKEVNLRYKGAEEKYESPLSEDDISDSEEEESKKRADKEESSLLQILDSWHNDGNSKRDESHRPVEFDSKQKLGKNYSFVVDDDNGNKNRLIDGILTNLKKSGNQRIPS